MDACAFQRASVPVLQRFGLNKFTDFQEHALKELLAGKDVFVNQPTGSGKSLIFQAMPLLYDYIDSDQSEISSENHNAIAIVISPLVSLMQDQVAFLQSKFIRAAFIGDEQTDEGIKVDIEQGKYQIVYGSPEAFLQNKRWRSMLANSVYKRNLKLISVDEAHCISHWGFAPRKGEKIFRVWFGRINEIRSVISSSVPVLALTATATKKTRNRIINTLEIKNVTLIKENPNRSNIAYSVQIVGNNTLQNFQSLIAEIKKQGTKCDRVVIYCQTIKAVTMVYAHFEAELGAMMYKDGSGNPKERLVEMFHARTDELNKNHILDSFRNKDGYVRVVIATIAYGMGIDCKGVKTVIHYGPSRNLEAYMQESGRAGRGHNSPCTAIILYNNLMLKHCSEDIVNYVRNQAECRRTVLLSHFDVDSDNIIQPKHPHLCCDICQKKCSCNGRQCDFSFFTTTMPLALHKGDIQNTKCRIVNSEQKSSLVSKLDYLEKSYFSHLNDLKRMSHTPLLAPTNLLCGFSDLQRSQVIEHCDKLFSLQDIYSYVDVWQPCIASDILFVMHVVFKDVDIDHETLLDEVDNELQCPPELDFVQAWELTFDDTSLLEIPEEYARILDDEDN